MRNTDEYPITLNEMIEACERASATKIREDGRDGVVGDIDGLALHEAARRLGGVVQYGQKRVFDQAWDENALYREANGSAYIYHVDGGPVESDDEQIGMFVRVQSWDPTRKHEEFRQFQNKRLRVTVEVIE